MALTLLQNCSQNRTDEETGSAPVTTAAIPVEVTEDKSSVAAYYELDHIKEWYAERILPPVFDYNTDLSGKSITELWLLRNEIFARNGYLFDDAVLRGYFNQFKWYQPIFDVPEFKVLLNTQEQAFVDKVLARENELAKTRYVQSGAHKMISLDHVYNQMQFKEVPRQLSAMLTERNFAIVPAKHEQFFHVYDNNHYQYVPNFITTDIYLQVLHKHFSTMLQKIEKDKFTVLLTGLLKDAHQRSLQFEKEATDGKLKSAARWTTTYLAIACHLITESPQEVSAEMRAAYESEMKKILAAEGEGSEFLGTALIRYSQFTPRGNYTRAKELERYFRCVKWLNTAPIYIDDDERLLSAVLLAAFIKRSPEHAQSFQTFSAAIKFIVGEEDNLSVTNLVNIMTAAEAQKPTLFNDAEKLNILREKLKAAMQDRIRPKSGDDNTAEALARPAILFTAGRYTFDAEVLSRLIHVLQPQPKRTLPKGLDIFASMGNKEAENILIKEYKEQLHWKAFPDSLKKLKSIFSTYSDWNKNIYTKTFETIKALGTVGPGDPLFMKTPFWDRKNLVTSLAAWTELKHGMLLYAEQPYGAQAGEGGGPPPPQHLSYVEPNTIFWEKALELIAFQEEKLSGMGLLNEDIQRINKDLKEIANLLLSVSEKELAGEKLTNEEFDELSWLGGRIEYLTFRIIGSDHLPEKERLVALVADVYNYNGTFLEEAVGMVDEIYVIAEINGKPYLTKGAVFSYYEFSTDEPLTDEQWQAQIMSGKGPDRPAWIEEITVDVPSLESKPGYSF